MKVSDAYSGSYLSVERWPVEPTEATIKEAGIDDDQFAKGDNARIVYIKIGDDEMKMRVNKTNAVVLAEMLGDELSGWIGATVEYFREQATIKGKRGWAGIIRPVAKAAPRTGKKK